MILKIYRNLYKIINNVTPPSKDVRLTYFKQLKKGKTNNKWQNNLNTKGALKINSGYINIYQCFPVKIGKAAASKTVI